MRNIMALSLIVLFCSGTAALAQHRRNTPVVQIQINCTLLGGLLADSSQQNLTHQYAEYLLPQLAAHHPDTYAIEDKPASWVYGASVEPRIFLGMIGAGMFGFLVDAQKSRSIIHRYSGTGTVEVQSYMSTAGVCPTLYFRPDFDIQGYIIFGFGAGGFRNTLELGIKDDQSLLGTSDPLKGYFLHDFTSSGTCYRGLIEIGITPDDSVFFYNIGLMFMHIDATAYKNRFSETLLLPATNAVYTGGMSNVSLYCGFGVRFG